MSFNLFETIKNSSYLVKSETFVNKQVIFLSCFITLSSTCILSLLMVSMSEVNLSLISNTIIYYPKKASRIISFWESESHSEPWFKSLNLIKLDDVTELQILSFVFSVVTYTVDCYPPVSQLSEYFSIIIVQFFKFTSSIQQGNHATEIFM